MEVIATKGKYYYIIAAKTGKELVQLPFGIRPCDEGCRCGLIRYTNDSILVGMGFNRFGKVVVEPVLVFAKPMVNGYAGVRMDDYRTNAVINHLGTIIYKEKLPGGRALHLFRCHSQWHR